MLRTRALPASSFVIASDARVQYKGLWFPWTTTADTPLERLPRATQSKGASAELTFRGTGIEYIATKAADQGSAELFLDEVRQEGVSLKLQDFPVFLGVIVFSRHGVPAGEHKLRIVHGGEGRINLEAFRVYGELRPGGCLRGAVGT